MAWNTSTKSVSFLGDFALPIFRVTFLLFVAPTLGSWELDSARDSTRFLINSRAHQGRAEAPCQGKKKRCKTVKTQPLPIFPAVQPSCNHHIYHSNWQNWSKNSNMFDKFAFFPSLWPTMMRYSSKSDFIPMALSCLSNLERIAQTFKCVPATVTSSVCKDTWIIQKSRIPIEVG